MIFDSHTHLNAEQFNEDIPETIQRAQEMGVTKMAVVGFDTPTIEKSLQLSHDYPNIYSIIGWHPTEAGSYTKEIENKLIPPTVSKQMIPTFMIKVVAGDNRAEILETRK